MLTETITINKGCRIVEKTNTVDAWFAAKHILSTEKQFKYTKAVYKSATDTVDFTRHICICPHCGSFVPAYEHILVGDKPRKKMTHSSAAKWCGDIRSLFDNEDKELFLYEPIRPVEEFICPNCGCESNFSHKTDYVIFEQNKHTLRVKCIVDRITDIINIAWAPTLDIISLPLVESIVFNFKKGKVHFEIHTPEGFLMRVRDVSCGIPTEKQTSKLICLINNNNIVKHKLIKSFNKIWGRKIPFTSNEVDLHKFIHMTTFVGYTDKSFYHNIPSDEYDFTIDPIFKKARNKLHNSDNCLELLNQSDLPKSKSIKKVMFTHPALFFYLDEINTLWELFGKDHNLLRSFLESKNAVANLYTMHTYPGIIEFYHDFANEKGNYDFYKLITFLDKKACKYGIFYSAFSESKKALERKTWSEGSSILKSGYQRLGVGINVDALFVAETEHSQEVKISDQNHNGYTFSVIKCRNQRVIAAEHLNNCLKSGHFTNLIIGVMKYGRYVAAVEVNAKENYIIQALIKDNEDIEEDKSIFLAFKKWCKANKMHYNNFEYPNVEAF